MPVNVYMCMTLLALLSLLEVPFAGVMPGAFGARSFCGSEFWFVDLHSSREVGSQTSGVRRTLTRDSYRGDINLLGGLPWI